MAEIVDFGLQQHKIKMDSRYFENVLSVVAGDTGRRIEVQLLDTNGMVQNTTGLNLRLNAEIAGKATFTDATLVDAVTGKYQLDLSNGMFLASGNWQFQWRITDSAGKKLHSFAFTGNIGKNISEGGSQATNFYLNLEDLKAMQDDLVNGTIDSSILETNITEKLTDLETQYAPKLTEVAAQLADTVKQGANESITNAMLSPEIKQSLNDGVWDFNMNTSNIEKGAVTIEKIEGNLANKISGYMEMELVLEKNKYFNAFSGALQVSTGFNSSKIDVIPNDKLKITTTITGTGTALAVFFKIDGTYLVALEIAGKQAYVDKLVTVPNNAYFIGVSSFGALPIIKKFSIVDTIKLQESMVEAQSNIVDIRETTSDYDDIKKKIANEEFGYIPKSAVVFTSDDGYVEDMTILKPIAVQKNIPITLSLFKGSPILSNNLSDVTDCVNNLGWEIALHGMSVWGDMVTESEIDTELKLQLEFLSNKGFTDVSTAVYPNGKANLTAQYVLSKYVDSSLKISNLTNTTRTKKHLVTRYWISTGKSMDYYKGIIDRLLISKTFVVFGIHGTELTSDVQYLLTQIIDYVQSKEIPITTMQKLYRLNY